MSKTGGPRRRWAAAYRKGREEALEEVRAMILQFADVVQENERLRDLVEDLRGLASSREAREATARAVTAEAAAYAAPASTQVP